jgi:hypothetical protein
MTPTATESQFTPPPPVALNVPAKAAPAAGSRISALDFTKGALVLLMVLYHWINYFIGPLWTYYTYLRFLTPSFIFITGFMVSQVYLSKYGALGTNLAMRLVTRGLKLLGVFLALNLGRILILPFTHVDVQEQASLSAANLFTVFVSGNLPNFGGKLVSFSILVSISYLLILAGVLVPLYRHYRYTFHAACAILFSSIAAIGWFGMRSYMLEFVTLGMLGVLTGFAPMAGINRLSRHVYGLIFAYAGYVIGITLWDVRFPLLVLGVPLSLLLIYLLGVTYSDSGALAAKVNLLGKYSLFAYISQIALLQFLAVTFRRFDLGVTGLLVSFCLAFVLTLASVEAVDQGRRRFRPVDSAYKVIFA